MLRTFQPSRQRRRAPARKILAHRRIACLLITLAAACAVATALSAKQSKSKSAVLFRDDFNGPLQNGWQWTDPQGNCTRSLDAHPGYLRIFIPQSSRHDLYKGADDYSAPRLTRKANGDFTLETKLTGPARTEGGLLVWKDERNFVRFERGVHFKSCLFLAATVNGAFSRHAMEYAPGDPTWLRLERSGSTYRASYSLDGKEWRAISRTYTGTKKRGSLDDEDWMNSLQEEDFTFQPVTATVQMKTRGPLQVGVTALTKGRETAVDYDYFEITGK